jgi:hypothetical protein
MDDAHPTLPGWIRLLILPASVIVGTAVVRGVTEGLHVLVHGGAVPTWPSR